MDVSDYPRVRVVIEKLDDEAENLGLTTAALSDRINKALRAGGLRPITEGYPDHYFYVNINVLKNSFNIEVSYHRKVNYRAGDAERWTWATTWSKERIGTSQSADYVLKSVAEMVNTFVEEFAKANE